MAQYQCLRHAPPSLHLTGAQARIKPPACILTAGTAFIAAPSRHAPRVRNKTRGVLDAIWKPDPVSLGSHAPPHPRYSEGRRDILYAANWSGSTSSTMPVESSGTLGCSMWYASRRTSKVPPSLKLGLSGACSNSFPRSKLNVSW